MRALKCLPGFLLLSVRSDVFISHVTAGDQSEQVSDGCQTDDLRSAPVHHSDTDPVLHSQLLPHLPTASLLLLLVRCHGNL